MALQVFHKRVFPECTFPTTVYQPWAFPHPQYPEYIFPEISGPILKNYFIAKPN